MTEKGRSIKPKEIKVTDKIHPLVTIGIPTYNRANNYLKQSLEVAVKQTYENIEIIVSDNCSDDNTAEVVKGFDDSRIRYFRQKENIGANNNFNFCLEQAKGVFFLLLLDDDLVDKDFVDVCMKAANYDSNVGIIFAGTRVIDENGKVLFSATNRAAGLPIEDFFLAWFEDKIPLYLCSTLFSTKILGEVGGFHSKTNLYQDVVAYSQIAARYGRIDVEEVKATFRIHQLNRGSAAKVSAWCEDSLYLLDIICEEVSEEKKELIRRRGMLFLCERCYRYAAVVISPLERFKIYSMVYKKFNYTYSPLRDIYLKSSFPKKVNQVKSIIKTIIKRAGVGAGMGD